MSELLKNKEEFDKIIKDEKGVMVLFYASWCPFSRMFLPVFEKMTKEKKGKFCRVQSDEIEGCDNEYSIEVYPTVIYFENGKVSKRLDGVLGIGLNEGELLKLAGSCGIK